MNDQAASGRFEWTILQEGQLPLRPDRTLVQSYEHRCTSILIWPHGEKPAPANTVMLDPCFTPAGYRHAAAALSGIGAALDRVGYIFVTHLHGDHLLHLPPGVLPVHFRPFRPGTTAALDGIRTVHCPGHHPAQMALVFAGPDGESIWAVGDAILDEDWLRAWGYYWPNSYPPDAVVETWRSVAAILASADVIVPGHGDPFRVTADLLRALIESFPTAEVADRCPDVAETLRARLDGLIAQESDA